jgi:SAM-dependent methyltransferase
MIHATAQVRHVTRAKVKPGMFIRRFDDPYSVGVDPIQLCPSRRHAGQQAAPEEHLMKSWWPDQSPKRVDAKPGNHWGTFGYSRLPVNHPECHPECLQLISPNELWTRSIGFDLSELNDSLREGQYARKQIFCRSGLIAWSHRRRFEIALEIAREFAGKRVVDYGCGDGTFLAMLMDAPQRPLLAVGAEVSEELIITGRQRFANRAGLEFAHVSEMESPAHAGKYDAVICMEVLEHVVDMDPMLAKLDRLLAPGGRLIVSVPVEIGLPVMVKQTVRRIAGWRGIGDYPGTSPYTMGELARSVFAGDVLHITRPRHRHPDASEFFDHKGFNWKWLRKKIGERFEVESTSASPIRWLGPQLASQVWMGV